MISKCLFTISLGMLLGLVANCRASIVDTYHVGDQYQFSCDKSLYTSCTYEASIINNNRGLFFSVYFERLTYKMKLYSFDTGSKVKCNQVNYITEHVYRDNVLEVLPNPHTRNKSVSEEFAPAVVETYYLRESETYEFICRLPSRFGGRVAWIQLDANNSVTDSAWGIQSSILTKNVSLTRDCDEVKLVCISYKNNSTVGHYQYSRQLEKVVILKPIPATTKSVGEYYEFTCNGDHQETSIFTNDHEVFSRRANFSSRALVYKIKTQSFDSGTIGTCLGAKENRKLKELVVRPQPTTVPESDEFEPGIVHEHEIEEYENYEFVCNKTQDVDEVVWIKVDANNMVRIAHHSSTDIRRTMTPTFDEFAGVKLVCASYTKRAFYDDGVHVADHYVRRIHKVVVFKKSPEITHRLHNFSHLVAGPDAEDFWSVLKTDTYGFDDAK